MRLLRLARLAFEAEGLHLRRLARARGIQAGLAAAAAVFALLLLLMLHGAAFAALLDQGWRPASAALMVAAGDLLVAAGLAIAARRAGRDPVGEEALKLRQAALREIGEDAARLLALAPLSRGAEAKPGPLRAALAAFVAGLVARR